MPKKTVPRKKPRKIIEEDDSSSDTNNDNDSTDNKSIDDERYHCSIDLSIPHINRETIEKIAGRKVNNLFHYQRALVHKSIQGVLKFYEGEPLEYMKESNERLEFLGDSFFGTIITTYLFKKYSTKDEGFLTKVRTRIVKGTAMAKFAEKIGIKDNILMTQYVVNAGGKENKRFLEDAFEAFVGAMFLDLGYEQVQEFSLDVINKFIDEKVMLYDDNYKDLLIRFCQNKKLETPEFKTIKEEGPAHKKTFTIHIIMYKEVFGEGVSNKKKSAEQIASKMVIDKLGIREELLQN